MNRCDFLKVITCSAAGATLPLSFIEAKEVNEFILASKLTSLVEDSYTILRLKTSEGNLDFEIQVPQASQGKIVLPTLEFTAEKTMTIYKVGMYLPDFGFINIDIDFNTNHVIAADTISISALLELNT